MYVTLKPESARAPRNTPAPSSYSVVWNWSKPFWCTVCLIHDSPTTRTLRGALVSLILLLPHIKKSGRNGLSGQQAVSDKVRQHPGLGSWRNGYFPRVPANDFFGDEFIELPACGGTHFEIYFCVGMTGVEVLVEKH